MRIAGWLIAGKNWRSVSGHAAAMLTSADERRRWALVAPDLLLVLAKFARQRRPTV